MNTFLIRIFDCSMNIIHTVSTRQSFMEGAEAEARRLCSQLKGYTWDVLQTV